MQIARRQFMIASSIAAVGLLEPRLAFAAAETDRRFVFIIQRGAADGIGILAPLGDPGFAGVRGTLAEDFASAAPLDGMFALHPALANLAEFYRGGEALFAHAVASRYRERSHFDGQNVLETGGASAYLLKDGWLNRLLSVLPEPRRGLAIGETVPMALRGDVGVASYAPSALPDVTEDLTARVSDLYAHDALLRDLWDRALAIRTLNDELPAARGKKAAATGLMAANLLKPANGARIATIELDGWDTHAQQRARLASRLGELDALVGALKAGLGPLWAETLVLVATEFGRTAAVNGTGGTDHGTASLAMLLGGAVNGGVIRADWPGLDAGNLLDRRDLRPTASLEQLVGSAAAEHFGLDFDRVARTVFPASDGKSIEGLIRA